MSARKLMAQIVAALAAMQLISSASTALSADACSPGQCVRIGSYNIKLFAKSGPANTQAEIDQLANRIASTDQANLDVVVLQEINKEGDNWKGADGLLAKLRKLGYELAIEGNFGGDDPARPQFVILLYRTKTISLVSAGNISLPTAFDVGGSCEYKSLRPPVTALLKSTTGKFSFQIVGVHLKSQNRVGNKETCDDDIRAFQAEKIVAAIPKLKTEKGEPNVIVVGDFNASFEAPEYKIFKDSGYQTLIEGDCSVAKLEQCSYIDPEYASIIDHIVVHSSLAQAVKGSGTKAKVDDLKKYLETQSDHLPVWASFRTDM
jgi:endonuclease/exonuclease/phosphatase family metal-dependent hydrolase